MSEKIRIVYIISNVQKALAFEWIADRLEKAKFDLSFVLIGQVNTPLEIFLKQRGIVVCTIKYNGKHSFLAAGLKTTMFLRKIKPHIVHTHLFEANLIGLTSAYFLRIRRRIYTRHHAMVHYNEYPKGLKWDKWCNFIATDIVAISKNVETILVERDKVDCEKISLIRHGFDFDYFNVPDDRVSSIKNKYGFITRSFPVVGVIARYIELKGIQYIISAFKKISQQWPDAHLILANATGDFQGEIQSQLNQLKAGSFTEITFEDDLAALYKLFDVFVHVPIDENSEAFGQTYVEALIAGVPSVFTLSGIAKEFIIDRKNAMVVNFKDSDGIAESVTTLLKDEALRTKIVEMGKIAAQDFSLDAYIHNLQRLYCKNRK
jgi:glycosyltransferase involved in cell wall biosynthesis